MQPRWTQLVFDTLDARRAAEFWRQLLGLAYAPGHEPPAEGGADHAGRDWLILLSPDGRRRLAFQQVVALQRPTWPRRGVDQQLHLDVAVSTPDELEEWASRVEELGGTELQSRRDDPDEPLVTLADPDGHPFCVFVSSWRAEA